MCGTVTWGDCLGRIIMRRYFASLAIVFCSFAGVLESREAYLKTYHIDEAKIVVVTFKGVNVDPTGDYIPKLVVKGAEVDALREVAKDRTILSCHYADGEWKLYDKRIWYIDSSDQSRFGCHFHKKLKGPIKNYVKSKRK